MTPGYVAGNVIKTGAKLSMGIVKLAVNAIVDASGPNPSPSTAAIRRYDPFARPITVESTAGRLFYYVVRKYANKDGAINDGWNADMLNDHISSDEIVMIDREYRLSIDANSNEIAINQRGLLQSTISHMTRTIANLRYSCISFGVDYASLVSNGASTEQIERAVEFEITWRANPKRIADVVLCAYDLTNGYMKQIAVANDVVGVTGLWQLKIIAFGMEYSYGSNYEVTSVPIDDPVSTNNDIDAYLAKKAHTLNRNDAYVFKFKKFGAPKATKSAFGAYLASLRAGVFVSGERNFNPITNNCIDFAQNVLTYIVQQNVPGEYRDEEAAIQENRDIRGKVASLMDIVLGAPSVSNGVLAESMAIYARELARNITVSAICGAREILHTSLLTLSDSWVSTVGLLKCAGLNTGLMLNSGGKQFLLTGTSAVTNVQAKHRIIQQVASSSRRGVKRVRDSIVALYNDAIEGLNGALNDDGPQAESDPAPKSDGVTGINGVVLNRYSADEEPSQTNSRSEDGVFTSSPLAGAAAAAAAAVAHAPAPAPIAIQSADGAVTVEDAVDEE